MPQPEGDCVDFSMLTAALCSLFGMPTAFKTIAAEPGSNAYSHVYVVVELKPGAFYALDTSNGPAPGMEFDLPRGKKSRVWANPADLKRPAMSITRPARHSRRRLGALDDEGNYIPDSPSPDVIAPGTYSGGYTDPFAPGGSLNPPASGGSFTQIATTVVNDATKLLAPIVRQSTIQAPYYIAGANGAQVLYDPSTGKTLNAGAANQLATAGSSGTLIALGLGLVAAVVIGGVFSKK
jgi:hypothetical protein